MKPSEISMNYSVKLTVFVIFLALVLGQEFCRDFVDLKRRGVDSNVVCSREKYHLDHIGHQICCAYWTTGEEGALVEHSQTYSRQKRVGQLKQKTYPADKLGQTNFTQEIYTNSSSNLRRSVKIDGIPWNLQTYCCKEYERCCSGTCCLREEPCCRDDTGNSTQQCCRAGCCRNSRGEVACCPEFTRQVLTIFAIIFIVYVGIGIKSAVRTFCNIRPVHLDDFNVLDEAHIKKMSYLFC